MQTGGNRLSGRIRSIVFVCLFFTVGMAATNRAAAQDGKIELANLDRLTDKAAQTVDVSLNENMIRLASKFLSSARSSDEAKLKEVVSKLKGIYVRSFEFDKEGQYSDADINPVISQLNAPPWSRIVGVVSKKNHEDVRVYVLKPGDAIEGLAIVAMEPKEITVVNIVGPIDIDRISELEGSFGIPKLNLEPQKPKQQEDD